jgi:autotransporter strand-loop-strand O-heptosyltransferase
VICSTFYNDLFSKIYPEILFAPPNTKIDNVYSQYYIGASNDGDIKYSPIKVDENPLQMVASSILGLDYKEIRPQLEKQLKHLEYRKKYVCISEYASHEKKMWKYAGGWQQVVDYLNSIDYDVVVISKEPTELKNIINLTGNHSILDRAQTLLDAEFFIGVSSGLSWLSWGVGTHVVMVSDYTQINHEFTTNCTRISANNDLKIVDYNASNITEPESVINSIKKYIESKN